jgi:hypothetical protein
MSDVRVSIKSDLERVTREFNNHTKEQVEKKARQAVNKVAATMRTLAARRVNESIKVKRGAARDVSKRIILRKTEGTLTATILFLEKGIGIDQTGKATVRKIRNSRNGLRVNFNGKTTEKSFSLPGRSVVFVRKEGKIKRMFSYTALQEAEKADVFEEVAEKAGTLLRDEFFRLLDL